MAGMFYSLQEAAKRLNITEEQLNELVKEGRLREFRDGSNVLFKVSEVESLMSDTNVMASKETSDQPEQEEIDTEEISLAPETSEDTAVGSELTDADTAITGQGINVLGETDSDFQITEDTMAETKSATDAASLEEIEEDVNLDTFGSGSGLLDLSLQADDTSLGGILDEIYTPEGEKGEETAKSGSAMEVAAEAEEMFPEAAAGPEPTAEVAVAAQAYIEPEPDVQSNIFGIVLFLPLLAVVYTAIVTVAGFNDAMPVTLGKIQGVIWYVVLGIAVAAIVAIGMSFMLGGAGIKVDKKPKARKEKKKKAKETPPPAADSETA